MIGFGCVVSDEDQFRRWALAGIERLGEPDAEIVVKRDRDCIFRAYNEICDELGERGDLEAVVLLHQDLEIVDSRFGNKVRARLAEPGVAIVGACGGVGVRGIAWWESREGYGAYGWDWLMDPEKEDLFDPSSLWKEREVRVADVDVVDGMLMVLSPRAARELRFDEETAPGFHGYDTDICTKARRRGWRVMSDEIDVIHHNTGAIPDHREFAAAHIALSTRLKLL